jgi:diacylglycerol kinase family enzyme
MRIAIVFNSRSGRGRAAAAFEHLRTALSADGHTVVGVPTQATDALAQAISGNDLVIAAGGDGTCNLVAGACMRTGAIMMPFPMGTENLLAREFVCSADVDVACAMIRNTAPSTIDVGHAAGAHFLLMCGIGPDASVTQRMTDRRNGAIHHLSYFEPILEEFMNPNLPALTIDVDGRRLVTAQRGMVLIANGRRFALGLNPAPDADMSDGQLDVVFMPARSGVAVLAWFVQAKAGQHLNRESIRTARGTHITILPDRPSAFQIDGDPGSVVGRQQTLVKPDQPLIATIQPLALRVLRRQSPI